MSIRREISDSVSQLVDPLTGYQLVTWPVGPSRYENDKNII